MGDVFSLFTEAMKRQRGEFGPTLPLSNEHQEKLIAIARENKLMLRLLGSGAISPSLKDSRSERLFYHQKNAQVLSLTRQVALALNAAQIRYVIYKGPVQQQVLYGSFFEKPAGDVDVLVPSRDFDRAKIALEGTGLTLPYECDRLWWRYVLGEQHFVLALPDRPTVDLHHKLQRPGCPSPRNVELFLAQPVKVLVGNLSVPTCSIIQVALLATLNLIKGIYDGDPSGGHAMDLSASLAKMTPAQAEELLALAKAQGLLRSLALGWGIADQLFGVTHPLPSVLTPSLDVSALSRITLLPSGAKNPVRRLLKNLADTPFDYGRDAVRHALGQMVRLAD